MKIYQPRLTYENKTVKISVLVEYGGNKQECWYTPNKSTNALYYLIN